MSNQKNKEDEKSKSGSLFPAILAGAAIAGSAFALYSVYKSGQEEASASSSQPPMRRPPQPPKDCVICLSELNSEIEILPCGHVYHQDCIKKCFKFRWTCPICKNPLTEEDKKAYKERLNIV